MRELLENLIINKEDEYYEKCLEILVDAVRGNWMISMEEEQIQKLMGKSTRCYIKYLEFDQKNWEKDFASTSFDMYRDAKWLMACVYESREPLPVGVRKFIVEEGTENEREVILPRPDLGNGGYMLNYIYEQGDFYDGYFAYHADQKFNENGAVIFYFYED